MQSMSEPSDSARIKIVPPQEGRELNIFGGPMIVKSGGDDAGFYLAEHPVPAGYMVPPHVHEDSGEVFWILEGELTLMTASQETKVGPGPCVLLPKGEPHGFRNDTATAVRMLVMCGNGPSALSMFRDFDQATRSSRGNLAPAEIALIAGRHQVRFA